MSQSDTTSDKKSISEMLCKNPQNCVYKLWSNFRKMFLNIKLKRIISSKHSKNLEEFLCAKDKAENQ